VLVAASIPGGQSIGTGWVLDAREGLIVTNFHVVNGADGITVTGQETSADAQVVGAAPCEDLAVLKLPETKGLKTLPLGSQDELRAGEAVVAIGYPVNASNEDKLVSTAGVVSVVQSELRARSAELPQFTNLVQTDAAINHGNSGGPLVDLRGRLVGVNTLVPPPGTGITGQGYAIGVDRVRPVVAQLRQGRSSGWAGFGFVFASDRQAKREGLPTKGLLISAAMPGTPATKAHIGKGGALMLAINGQTLEGTMADYCSKVEGIELGQSVPVTLLDAPGDKPRTVAIEFG
jgi:serine protease Do